jgi:hypothetical protein
MHAGCWLVGLAFTALAGCLSPTLPSPPPDPSMTAIASDGLSVRLQGGGVPARSYVHFLNEELQSDGVFTLADGGGHYARTVPLDLPRYGTNTIEIWWTYGNESSEINFYRIPQFGSWSPTDAGAE